MNSSVVLITGALSGIGKATAVAFAAAGFRFAGSDDRKAALVARVPFKRAGTFEEIADAIAFLASDKASFITGQIIDVNGGITAS
jgi:NAD(P)-dependent dehydrogenase (short-subunit alcohol dehydrogenase family)